MNALAGGEVAVAMAWSGDIFQRNQEGDPDGLQFVFPDEATLAELRTYRELRDDDEIAQWNDAFGEFSL